MFKTPKNDDKYVWTTHVVEKMLFYGISEGRIKRIIRFPTRIEEGIVENTIAVMQPASTSTINGKQTWKQEIWVMYKLVSQKKQVISNDQFSISKQEKKIEQNLEAFRSSNKQIKIITAWKYPGVSSKRDPIPEEVLEEIKNIL